MVTHKANQQKLFTLLSKQEKKHLCVSLPSSPTSFVKVFPLALGLLCNKFCCYGVLYLECQWNEVRW